MVIDDTIMLTHLGKDSTYCIAGVMQNCQITPCLLFTACIIWHSLHDKLLQTYD